MIIYTYIYGVLVARPGYMYACMYIYIYRNISFKMMIYLYIYIWCAGGTARKIQDDLRCLLHLMRPHEVNHGGHKVPRKSVITSPTRLEQACRHRQISAG